MTLEKLTAGELAALYILAVRGVKIDFSPAEIQDQLESLVGDLHALSAIKNVRIAIDQQ